MQPINAKNETKDCEFGISSRFKQIRLEQKMTQKDFGLSLEIGPTTVSKIEKSKKTISCEVLVFLRQKYKTDINWLLTGEMQSEQSCQIGKFHFLDDLYCWLEEIVREDSERSTWFRIELLDKFPLFNEWLKKRRISSKDTNRRMI
jgi:transcriptional regulator with XRE-family HTH domain